MKAATAHAESLRREQSARVRATHRFLVAADVLGDFERCHQTVRQSADAVARCLGDLAVVPSMLLIGVQLFPHDVLRDSVASRAAVPKLT